MSDRFISEAEVADAKKKRQEEWERVRNAEDPKDAPEAPVDNRSLYERLKEQKDKKDMEATESKAFKNMVRGLDSEETAFLDMVDNLKEKEARRLKDEEEELLAQVKQAAESVSVAEPKLEEVLGVPGPSSSASKTKKAGNRQAQLLSSVVKRKSSESKETLSPPLPKQARPTAQVVLGMRKSAMVVAGVVPGMGDYDSEDSEDSNSSTSNSELKTEVMKTYPLSMPQNQPEAAGGAGKVRPKARDSD